VGYRVHREDRVSKASGPVAHVSSLSDARTVDSLVAEVHRSVPLPVSVLQVAALLESAGVTDAAARARYGHDSVFVLAKTVGAALLQTGEAEIGSSRVSVPLREADRDAAPGRRASLLADYLRGPFSLLPLVLLSVMIGAFQAYGAWGSGRVLVLSGATIGSLLVTGGFVQVAARRGSIYLSQGYARSAARFLTRLAGVSLVTVLAAAGLITLGGRSLGLLSSQDLALLALAFVLLSVLWLLSGVLAIVQRSVWFGISLALGSACSYATLMVLTEAGVAAETTVAVAVGVGFGVAGLAMTGAIVAAFRGLWPDAADLLDTQVPPPAPQLVVGLAPYFLYGVVYLLTVLAGHVGGWGGWLPVAVARLDALSVSEMGLTLALVPFMLVGGVAEHTMQRFWLLVRGHLAATPADLPGRFSDRIRDFYDSERYRYVIALGSCTVGVVVAVFGAAQLSGGRVLGAVWSDSSSLVFSAGVLGYGALALGVFDAMFLITLSRPRYALEALGVGLVASLIVSLWAGYGMSYAHGALGAVGGGLAFLFVAHQRVGHLMRHIDFYYYASF